MINFLAKVRIGIRDKKEILKPSKILGFSAKIFVIFYCSSSSNTPCFWHGDEKASCVKGRRSRLLNNKATPLPCAKSKYPALLAQGLLYLEPRLPTVPFGFPEHVGLKDKYLIKRLYPRGEPKG